MEGIYWGLGILFALFALVAGWLFVSGQSNHKATISLIASQTKELKEVRSDISKMGERMAAQETMMQPLWEACKQLVPQIMQLHKSPDVLAEALDGDPDTEKIRLAEEMVEEYRQRKGTDLATVFAVWMLGVRKIQLQEKRG